MNTPDDAHTLLQHVYAGTADNRLRHEAVFSPDTSKGAYLRLQRWARPLEAGEPGVLCRQRAARGRGGGIAWYGVARSERDLRRLGEELVAFVGPSVSDVSRERSPLDLADPIEVAIHAYSDGHAIRFQGDDKRIAEALDLLFQTRSRKEARAPISTASPGLVLRRFHMALVAGVPDEADTALREIRERGLLTPLNLHFLQVQRAAAFGEWDAIVSDDPTQSRVPLARLLAVRRPRAVTEALLRAVYYRHLAGHQGDTDAFLRAFRSDVEVPFAPLFSAPAGFHSPEALRAFMALAAASDDASLRDRVSRLAEEAGLNDPLLSALASRVVQAAPPPPTPDAAAKALLVSDFGRAFEVAVALPPSVDVARVLLQCAYELQTPETRDAAIEVVEGLDPDERAGLLTSRSAQDAYRDIVGEPEAPATTPTSWLEWIRAALDGSITHARAVHLATTAGRGWTAEQIVRNGAAAPLADALEDAATTGTETWRTVQPALPHLIGAFQHDPHYPRPELHDLYCRLAEYVSLADAPGDADLAAYTDLASAVLRGPTDAVAYDALLGQGISLWQRAESSHRLDWLLDTLEVLAVHAAPAPDARTRFVAVAAGSFTQHRRRATDDQLDLLQSVASEIDASEIVADLSPVPVQERTDDPYAHLSGLRVAVYTLERRAAARVRDTLAMRCPDARVDLAHDMVCTDSLKSLARNALVFVVATGSATHSATDCIAQNHPYPLVYPSGKGSASILAALRDHSAIIQRD